MTMKGHEQIGRLAMREEGENWVAYYAMPDTMDGAVFLGAIKLAFVAGAENAERKAAFMDMMRECVGDVIEEKVGTRPVWGGPKEAPEHERSGQG